MSGPMVISYEGVGRRYTFGGLDDETLAAGAAGRAEG